MEAVKAILCLLEGVVAEVVLSWLSFWPHKSQSGPLATPFSPAPLDIKYALSAPDIGS